MSRYFVTTSLGAVAQRLEQRTHKEIPKSLKMHETLCI